MEMGRDRELVTPVEPVYKYKRGKWKWWVGNVSAPTIAELIVKLGCRPIHVVNYYPLGTRYQVTWPKAVTR